MNNKAHLRPKDFDSNGDIIPMSWKEEKGDLISREALKKELEKIFFYDNDDMNRIVQIIDNAPTVELYCSYLSDGEVKQPCVEAPCEHERPQGEWIVTAEDNDGVHRICCPFCHYEKGSNNTDPIIFTFFKFPRFCEGCGADMRGVK